MKSVTLLLLFVFCFSLKALTVTSLNIQWYGRGGRIEGNRSDEYRQKRIKEFLTQEMPSSDVYAFQEVIEPELIAKLVPHMECHTYDVDNKRAQHIVLCANPLIIVGKEVDEPTRLGRFGLRPGVILKVRGDDGGVVSVVGVHLKAGKNDTQTRLDQLKALSVSPFLTEKTIIVGDFNNYDKVSTGLEQDDIGLMELLLNPEGFAKLDNKTATYLGYNNRVFDWVWIKGLSSTPVNVIGPCRQDSVRKPFKSYGFFKRFVSDHCALQVSVH